MTVTEEVTKGAAMTEEVKEPQEEKAPEQTPAEKTYTQKDMDAIAEKVKASERMRVMAEIEERRKAESLTELEKAQKALETERAARLKAESESSKASRTADLLRRVKPDAHVPALYLEHVVTTWNGEEWDAEQAFAKAREMWEAERGTDAATPKTLTKQAPAAMRSGTPITENSRDFASMTGEQVKARALEMARDPKQGPYKAKQFVADASAYRATGARFVDESK